MMAAVVSEPSTSNGMQEPRNDTNGVGISGMNSSDTDQNANNSVKERIPIEELFAYER